MKWICHNMHDFDLFHLSPSSLPFAPMPLLEPIMSFFISPVWSEREVCDLVLRTHTARRGSSLRPLSPHIQCNPGDNNVEGWSQKSPHFFFIQYLLRAKLYAEHLKANETDSLFYTLRVTTKQSWSCTGIYSVSSVLLLPLCKWGGWILWWQGECLWPADKSSSLLLWGNGTEWGIFFWAWPKLGCAWRVH